MIRFGPAGNAKSFYEAGYSHTVDAPQWLASMGLTAYECSWGRGVSIGEETARTLGERAREHGIQLSAHAPYFINFSNRERWEKSVNYVLDTARALSWMGGERVVIHVGAQQKRDRAEAFADARDGMARALDALEAAGLGSICLCPETMGKGTQIVNLAECLEMCREDKRLIPAIDFGHLHAEGVGAINGRDDYARILDNIAEAVPDRVKDFHIHFSRIEYTKAGEKRHRSYNETEYGPDFEPLAALLKERGLEPVVICESKDTMAEDAAVLKALYEAAAGQNAPMCRI